MTLRSKLIVAFLAISVAPLSAVTLFSYYSSERALRRAAEQQADTLAAELGHRMEWVTSDLQRRMDRAWLSPASPASPQRTDQRSLAASASEPQVTSGSTQAMAGHLANVLGEVASVVDTVEFVPPAPPPAPGDPAAGPTAGPEPQGLPKPPGAPASQAPRDGAARSPSRRVRPIAASPEAGRVVIEMAQIIAERLKQSPEGNVSVTQADVTALTQALQNRVSLAMAQPPAPGETTRGREPGRRSSAGAARQRADVPAGPVRTTTVLRGNALRTDVQQDGRPVGRIDARLNSERLFRAVLTGSRRDRQEIPFAVDADGHLHSPRPADRTTIQSLSLASSLPPDGVSVRSVNDWVVATRRDPSGVTFGIARPLGEDLRDLRRVSARNFGAGLALIALVFAGSVTLSAGMTRNLKTLMGVVRRVSGGDLSARVPVRSRDEFGRLGMAFNQMADNLAAHEKLVVERERMRRELELCRQIQNDMLPRERMRLGLTEVVGVSIPAREVGGDFFNYFALPDGRIALLVGDVSGKGVGAAILMANIQATLRARLPLEQDLSRLADVLDRDLEQSTPPEVYSTLFVGILDPRRHELRYVNAGHNTQFVLRGRGGLDRLSSTGRPLGLLAGNGYEERSVSLDAGDMLFFYTDGMVEAESESGDAFGVDRLESLLLEGSNGDVDALLARVENTVKAFRGTVEPVDDATMMALRFARGALAPAVL